MTAYITHEDCYRHVMAPDHPECPARLSAIEDQLHMDGLLDLLNRHAAPLVTREQLARVHSPAYIDSIFAASPDAGVVRLDPDTAMNPHTLTAARRAAGALVLATDLVVGGKERNAFCNVRPPGHHAEHAQAMGFCFFNNVAVGVAHALEAWGLQRIAILDFDVHHGNGTEDIFVDDQRVLLCSTFQHPLYPYKAGASRPAHLVNVPLPAGTSGAGFREAITRRWFPELTDFRPEIIYISAGFDGHREDPLAGMNLIEADYAWVTAEIVRIAEDFSCGRIVSTLEGGYALSALGRSAAAHIRALAGMT